MLDIPTKHHTYSFPLSTIAIKSRETGGCIDAEVVQLTRFRSYWYLSGWSKFKGPFATPCQIPEDIDWNWNKFVRRVHKNPWARCAALQTPDHRYQGAIIYREDGVSLIEPYKGSVYAEYLATAPWNRSDYAARPLYRGVGEGLMFLAILHSYELGYRGRVTLFSLPRALDFYKKLKFIETGHCVDRMIGCELMPDAAITQLQDKGLIR